MRVASSFKNWRNPMYLDGIVMNTSTSDYATVRQAYLARFDGRNWVRFGELLEAK
jgi:branched-chain amino acid transport system substrate-binding protein